MLYGNYMNRKRMSLQAFRLKIIFMLVLAGVSCTPDDKQQESFPIGIWQGSGEDQRISIEFCEDGRAILVSEGEDEIGIAVYSIDLQQQPTHLDIEFRNQRWGPIRTLIEQIDTNTIRIEHFKEDTTRPDIFTIDAIILHRTQSHVLSDKTKPSDECQKKIHQKLMMDSIWFGGKQQKELLAVCESLFRYQFTYNASGSQQKASAYYLSIDYKDPPMELLTRFWEHSPPIKPGTEFRVGVGIKFEIRSIIWLDKTTVEVEGGYYEGNVSSSGNKYLLRCEDGVWKVIKVERGWIS